MDTHMSLAQQCFHTLLVLGLPAMKRWLKVLHEQPLSKISATGANWSFSPNLDQPKDIRWGRVYEAFSDADPDSVQPWCGIRAWITIDVEWTGSAGPHQPILNTKTLPRPRWYGMEYVTNTNFNIDQGVTPASEEMLRKHYLPPFAEAIDAGALSVMVGLDTG